MCIRRLGVKSFINFIFQRNTNLCLAVNHIWLVILYMQFLSFGSVTVCSNRGFQKRGFSKNCPVVLWSCETSICLSGHGTPPQKTQKTYCNPLNPSLVRLNSLLAVAHVSSKVCWATGSTGSSAASHFFRSPLEEGRLSVSDWFWVGAGLDSAGAEGDSSTSSTGLWALRFWLSLRRICFFSLCYTEVIA